MVWDKKQVLADLQSWPTGKIINWTQFANDHNVPGRNAGQIVKEFATESGIDVFQLDQRTSGTRMRARKLRMTGGGITMPTHRSEEGIKNDWNDMIKDGELCLGEPCNPHTITKYTTRGGELERKEITVYGRKIPLHTLRQKMLLNHEQFMHLHTDEELVSMTNDDLLALYNDHKIEVPKNTSKENLISHSQYERTRTIGIWHDHSTILGHGYIVVTVKVFYDNAVHKRDSELTGKHSFSDIQAHIEELQIHILAMCSSSVEDQAALIRDRIEDIREIHDQLTTSEGIKITDRLLFFYGDKPAAQFERGTQIGGSYPCGSCGCESHRMNDLAYCKWRSLMDQQALVLTGTLLLLLYKSLHALTIILNPQENMGRNQAL